MGILDGKVAIVTGAGQGVGEGISIALAKEGAIIIVTGRTESKLVRTSNKIIALGGKAFPLKCDVSIKSDIDHVVDHVVSEYGSIDILINNAQTIHLGLLDDHGELEFAESFDSGPLATFRFMKAVRPHMTRSGGGNIINLASSATNRWDAKGIGLYAAAKQAIRSLTRAAACEWAIDNIRVNVITPVATTPALEKWIEEEPEAANAILDTIPMRRIGDAEIDIGRAVVFLVGPDARYITGLTLPLDGGQASFG